MCFQGNIKKKFTFISVNGNHFGATYNKLVIRMTSIVRTMVKR